jgi:hypothetical protein
MTLVPGVSSAAEDESEVKLVRTFGNVVDVGGLAGGLELGRLVLDGPPNLVTV